MFISHTALNRIVEKKAAEDDAYRRLLERNGRPLLSHGRALSDDALLAKLRSLGLDVQCQCLRDDLPSFFSAQEVAEEMIDRATSRIPDAETDWVWIAITCLWERWRPELPNMEMVDDKMQAGYAALKTGDGVLACRLWLEAWRAILNIMRRGDLDSLDDFDGLFGGTQSVFNWVQDLETELHNAGLREPHFFRERIALCETMVNRFDGGRLTLGNFKRALAESHFELGNREIGDQLFRGWLDQRPQWGWGWIGWSDYYWLFARKDMKDAVRAEVILKEGLATPDVEDRAHILERLAGLYEETDRGEQAKALRVEIEQLLSPRRTTAMSSSSASVQVKQAFDFGEEGLPLERSRNMARAMSPADLSRADPFAKQTRIGRNEPCPCGSGQKFKKCCMKKQGDTLRD